MKCHCLCKAAHKYSELSRHYVWTTIKKLSGCWSVLVIDCYSRYPEAIQLHSTTSSAKVNSLRSIFGRHGISSTLVTDNGSQFNCSFLLSFPHNMASIMLHSPRYPQSNRLIERAVRTVEGLLKGSSDLHMALIS